MNDIESEAVAKSGAKRGVAPPVARPPGAGADAETGAPARAPGLGTLARRINASHRRGGAGALRALEHVRRAGELLLEAKARLGHGKFQAWVEAHCRCSYRSAANYMEVHRRWDEVRGLAGSEVHRDAPLGLSGVLRALASPRPTPAAPPGVEPPAEPVGMGPGGTAGRGRRGSGPPAVIGPKGDAPSGVARPADPDGGVGPGAIPAGGPAAGTSPARRESNLGEAVAGPATGSGPREAEGGPAVAAGPVRSDAALGAAGALPSGRSPERVLEGLWLARLGGIRPQLVALGNAADFDRDAAAWRLLRPVAGTFLRRLELPGSGGRAGVGRRGMLAPAVARLALARPPGEWTLCPDCGGAGHVAPRRLACPGCSGSGYLVEEAGPASTQEGSSRELDDPEPPRRRATRVRGPPAASKTPAPSPSPMPAARPRAGPRLPDRGCEPREPTGRDGTRAAIGHPAAEPGKGSAWDSDEGRSGRPQALRGPSLVEWARVPPFGMPYAAPAGGTTGDPGRVGAASRTQGTEGMPCAIFRGRSGRRPLGCRRWPRPA